MDKTVNLQGEKFHKRMVTFGVILLVATFLDAFLLLGSIHVFIFIIQLVLMLLFVVLIFVAYFTKTHGYALYRPIQFFGMFLVVFEVVIIILDVITAGLFCNQHRGCFQASIFYGLNVAFKFVLIILILTVSIFAYNAAEEETIALSYQLQREKEENKKLYEKNQELYSSIGKLDFEDRKVAEARINAESSEFIIRFSSYEDVYDNHLGGSTAEQLETEYGTDTEE